MRAGVRTVRDLLTTMLTVSTTVIVLVGAIGCLSIFLATRSVNFLTDELSPAILANAQVLQELTNAETELRAFALVDDQTAVTAHHLAVSRLAAPEAELRDYATAHPKLTKLVQRQEQAADRWLDDYARARLAAGGGPDNFDRARYDRGVADFAAIRAANDAVDATLAKESAAAQSKAHVRLRRTLRGIALFALVGAGFGWYFGRRVVRAVRTPLADLETVVARRRGGDDSARAAVDGPREIRSVAVEFNELCEENDRARSVEDAVRNQMREMDAAKGDFVSNVSHELRTPLTNISGYFEVIEEDVTPSTPDEEEAILAIRRNISRLHGLIEDLLTLSRAEDHQTNLEQLDLCEEVSDVVKDLRFTAQSHDITLDVTTGPEDLIVLGDRTQLHRALLNVVGNAVKFSHSGSRVRIVLGGDGPNALVSVEDQGIGIPADELVKVGRRFYRASNAVTTAVPGTGLGLRIVQTIIENHGGSVHIDSVEHHGTTVQLRLPLQADLTSFQA